ncbi:MAG: hypothetical protein SFV19_20385 [Rhodospirillaceae bacterium]|nr:hypothetical protein [Rhodospirillaceae bacterium]
MTHPARPLPDLDDDSAERAALQAAVDEARCDTRVVPHKAMRDWLLEVAEGKFDAPPPVSSDSRM